MYCKVCNKTFNGPEPARQHYSSAQHLKKASIARMKAENSDGVRQPVCNICHITCDTPLQLDIHEASPRHMENAAKVHVQQRHNADSPLECQFKQLTHDIEQLKLDVSAQGNAIHPKAALPSVERQFMPIAQPHDYEEEQFSDYEWNGLRGLCKICNVDFTSESHKNDHLKGAKHAKKKKNIEYGRNPSNFTEKFSQILDVEQGAALLQAVPEDSVPQVHTWNGVTGMCKLCGVQFTSRQHAEQHLVGKNHLKKRQAFELGADCQQTKASGIGCGTADVGLGYHTQPTVYQPKDQHDRGSNQTQEYVWDGVRGKCYICPVDFTSVTHKDSHLGGKPHAKRKQIWEYERHSKIISGNSADPSTLLQDMSSPIPSPSLALSSISSDKTIWYDCPVCRKKVNSPEQLELHVQSHGIASVEQRKCGISRETETTIQAAKMKAKQISMQQATTTKANIDAAEVYDVRPSFSHAADVNSLSIQPGMTKMGQIVTEPSSFHAKKQTYTNPASAVELSDACVSETYVKKPFQHFPVQSRGIPVSSVFDDSALSLGSLSILPANSMSDQESETQLSTQTVRTSGIDHSSYQSGSGVGQTRLSSVDGMDRFSLTRGRDRVGPEGESEPLSYSDGYPSLSASEAPLSQYNCPSAGLSGITQGTSFLNTMSSVPDFQSAQQICGKGPLDLAAERAWLEVMPSTCNFPQLVKTATVENCVEREPQFLARSYLGELYQKAMIGDTVCFLPTGTGDLDMACMVLCHMLEINPRHQAVFLSDQPLNLLKYRNVVNAMLGKKAFNRSNPESGELEIRPLRVCVVCEGTMDLGGLPVWKQDIVIATAESYQGILTEEKTCWEANSIIIMHQIQLCARPSDLYVRLLRMHHFPMDVNKQPKLLGLLSSTAGKSSTESSVSMIRNVLSKLEDVKLETVQTCKQKLEEYRSNTLIHMVKVDMSEEEARLQAALQRYLCHCCSVLAVLSNLRLLGMSHKLDDLHISTAETSKSQLTPDFVLELLACMPHIHALQQEDMSKVSFIADHTVQICDALLSLEEIGLIGAYSVLAGLLEKSSLSGFDADVHLQHPCNLMQQLTMSFLESQHLGGLVDKDVTKNIDAEVVNYPVLCKVLSEVLGNQEVDEEEEDDFNPISVILVRKPQQIHLVYQIISKAKEVKDAALRIGFMEGKENGFDPGKFDVIVTCCQLEKDINLEGRQVVVLYLGPTDWSPILEQLRGMVRQIGSQFLVVCRQNGQKQRIQDIITKERHIVAALGKI